MFEYQVIVRFNGIVLFKTEWHVGPKEAREIAWLMASRLGEQYEVCVGVRNEALRAIPWNEFGLEVAA
jgi:hypothetical protein